MSAILKQQRLNRVILVPAFLALVLIGLWLRLRFIHTVNLYPDEFVTLLAVRMIGQKGWPQMPSGLFYDHGLLFSYLGSLAALWGPDRLAVRYASLAAGLLAVGLVFFLGRRWFSPGVGLAAAAGLVIAPAAIHWSGRARMYGLLQLLVLLVLWLAYEGIARGDARRRWLALLAYLGAVLTHFAAVALAPPLLVAAGLGWWARRRAGAAGSIKRAWPELLALGLVLAAAFVVKRAGQPKGVEALAAANALPGLAQVLTIYSEVSLNPVEGWLAIAPFYTTLPAALFAPFAVVALAAAGWRAGKALLSPAFFLALVLLLTTLEMVLFVSADRRDDKYLFMLLPALLLLGAQGMVVAGGWLLAGGRNDRPELARAAARPVASLEPATRGPVFSAILPALLAAVIVAAAWPGAAALLANTGDDYDTAFAYVRARWQPGDAILTGTPAAAAFYLGRNDFYAVQRRGGYDYRLLVVNGRPVDRWLGSPAIRTDKELHQALAGGRVWLVLERWGLQREYYDLPFQQQLLAQTEAVDEVQAQGMFVLRSRADPRPLAMTPAHSVEASFAGRVRLLGYTAEPEPAEPGRPLRLTLYWLPEAPLAHDYTVFVHLRRPGGETVAQADHRPLGRLYPTSLWPPGEIIRESSELALPAGLPGGTYELWVGWYLLDTGERLAVANDASGENAVRLGQVTLP